MIFPELYTAGHELITDLVITFRTQNYVPKTLFSLALPPGIKAGDIAIIFWDSEFTNNFPFNAMIAGEIFLGHSSSPTDILAIIKNPNGDNISAAQHHSTQVRGAIPYVFSNDPPLGACVNVVCYSASSGASSSGSNKLVSEQNYGYLKMLLFRKG